MSPAARSYAVLTMRTQYFLLKPGFNSSVCSAIVIAPNAIGSQGGATCSPTRKHPVQCALLIATQHYVLRNLFL